MLSASISYQLDSAVMALRIAMQNDSACTRYEASRESTHPAWKEAKAHVYKAKGAKAWHK